MSNYISVVVLHISVQSITFLTSLLSLQLSHHWLPNCSDMLDLWGQLSLTALLCPAAQSHPNTSARVRLLPQAAGPLIITGEGEILSLFTHPQNETEPTPLTLVRWYSIYTFFIIYLSDEKQLTDKNWPWLSILLLMSIMLFSLIKRNWTSSFFLCLCFHHSNVLFTGRYCVEIWIKNENSAQPKYYI